jgi:hypothetical protein
VDNIIAALEHNDRIREISLTHWGAPISELEIILPALIQPFPTLTSLVLQHHGKALSVVPASFLGGSAPYLQKLWLNGIPFPGLPNLLSSATHLVHIKLLEIPHSGYISPEAMVTALSVLTRLEALHIGFESPRSRPDWENRCPPPPTRTPLPVLTELWFQGVSEYLEDFLAWVDVPLLEELMITFFHQLIFDTPELTRFITRAPKFKAIDGARVMFTDSVVSVTFPQTPRGALKLGILCRESDWQLSSLAQVCSSSFPRDLIPAVERLYVTQSRPFPPPWQEDMESSQWLELMHPFTAVKGLYMSQEFTPRISPALQELVGERVTEVLPALKTLFLESLPSGNQEAIEQFVTARQLASQPIAVSPWERE